VQGQGRESGLCVHGQLLVQPGVRQHSGCTRVHFGHWTEPVVGAACACLVCEVHDPASPLVYATDPALALAMCQWLGGRAPVVGCHPPLRSVQVAGIVVILLRHSSRQWQQTHTIATTVTPCPSDCHYTSVIVPRVAPARGLQLLLCPPHGGCLAVSPHQGSTQQKLVLLQVPMLCDS
jgi:hypothetical protein